MSLNTCFNTMREQLNIISFGRKGLLASRASHENVARELLGKIIIKTSLLTDQ